MQASLQSRMEPKQTNTTQKKTRAVCTRCQFPKERACICQALPDTPLSTLFRRCRVIVLQHPHELRRKNRSLPLVELALFGKHQKEHQTKSEDDFVMKTIVGRRIGDKSDQAVMKLLNDPEEVAVLVFPHLEAMDLEDGLALAESRIKGNSSSEDDEGKKDIDSLDKKINLIFIDASWKHAKEMENKSQEVGGWPKNLIRVQLTPSTENAKATSKNSEPVYLERRFQIRAPPSPDHLSTAECLAWIVSRVEENPEIYEGIMKVLDYMVELWRSHVGGDNKSREMSQKKRKITSNKK